MEQLSQVLQSYFHFRRAVLHLLVYEHLSKQAFADLTGLGGNSKYRRQTNPGLWQPAEIYRLALALGHWDGLVKRIDQLANLIEHLPPVERQSVLKISKLTDEKLRVRLQDSDAWQAEELAKLKYWLDQASRF